MWTFRAAAGRLGFVRVLRGDALKNSDFRGNGYIDTLGILLLGRCGAALPGFRDRGPAAPLWPGRAELGGGGRGARCRAGLAPPRRAALALGLPMHSGRDRKLLHLPVAAGAAVSDRPMSDAQGRCSPYPGADIRSFGSAGRVGRKADTLAHRQFGCPLTGGYPAAARGPMAMPSLARRRFMRASSPLFQRREDGQCGERRRPSDPGDGAPLPPHHRPWQQPRSRKRRGQPAGASATKGSDADRL